MYVQFPKAFCVLREDPFVNLRTNGPHEPAHVVRVVKLQQNLGQELPALQEVVNVATTEPILARVATAAWNQDTLIVSKFLRPQVQVEAPSCSGDRGPFRVCREGHRHAARRQLVDEGCVQHVHSALDRLNQFQRRVGTACVPQFFPGKLPADRLEGPLPTLLRLAQAQAHDGVPHDAWVRGEGLRGPRLPQILLPVLRRQDACDQTD
mmetsp:Transcript_8103/g.24269  ORF Transcript_8103/g.24269 Transcript_8103/m.24269 type:complete len:208 (+) Transcript_8103:158-781(+)